MIHARRLTPMILMVTLWLTACAPVYRDHGYAPDDSALGAVVVGQTTRDELPGLIGSPSAQGVLTGSNWFYVRSRFAHVGPYKPREITREVVAISFADTGTVSNVERFGLERGRVVALSRRVNDPGVSAANALRQILGNFGRFRAEQIFDQ